MKGGDSRERKNGPFPRAEGAETPLSREEGDDQADAGASASGTAPAVGAPAKAPRGISRRGLLGLAGAGVAGLGIGIAADRGVQALAAAGDVLGAGIHVDGEIEEVADREPVP
ncbi:hypothetical protein QN345_18930, partial [Cryobacterium sp. 10I1]|nr:hypothetical protein [Cryobacterium sp. 10I1]